MSPRATTRAALAALALAAPPGAAKGAETPAAREQARLCERLDGEDALAACRQALALGMDPPRRAAVRQLLARRLAALERWEDLAELLRESVRLDPAAPEVWARLGAVLLYGLERPVEAVAALDQAARLAPDAAPPRVDLGVALASAGRLGESVAAFDTAEALDPAALGSRPAARAVRDAARAGRRWPQ